MDDCIVCLLLEALRIQSYCKDELERDDERCRGGDVTWEATKCQRANKVTFMMTTIITVA